MLTEPTDHDDSRDASEDSGIPGITARNHALWFYRSGLLLHTTVAVLCVFVLPHIGALFDHFETQASGLCKAMVAFGGHNLAFVVVGLTVVASLTYRYLPRLKLLIAIMYAGIGGILLVFLSLSMLQALAQVTKSIGDLG